MAMSFFTLADKQVYESTKDNPTWIHVEDPTEDELSQFEELTKIPKHIFSDIKDDYEVPHLDTYGDNLVFFIDIPVKMDSTPKHKTRPMCLILHESQVFSITGFHYELLSQFKVDHVEEIDGAADLFLSIIHTVLYSYIKNINEMEEEGDWGHDDYKHSFHDKDSLFFELLDLQKSLIDFETSVEANQLTIQNLKDHQKERFNNYQLMLIDNLLVESSQISSMCTVFGEVLNATASMSETILSNHLNSAMKKLTAITIIVSVPTLVLAAFTMNINIPGAWSSMEIPVILAIIFAVVAALVLRRRKML